MKLGISIKIDVKKLDKARFFQGEKGTYVDLTTFIDTENAGEYGDHGFITQSATKEEREADIKMPIVGNSTVFWHGESSAPQQQQRPAQQSQSAPLVEEGFDDDIPF